MQEEQDDRDIDNDLFLLNNVRMFYSKEHEEKPFRWHLEQHGYSKQEIDRALSDYYWVHIRCPIIIDRYLMPVCVICVGILLILYISKLFL